jgi:hypothetical protein
MTGKVIWSKPFRSRKYDPSTGGYREEVKDLEALAEVLEISPFTGKYRIRVFLRPGPRVLWVSRSELKETTGERG